MPPPRPIPARAHPIPAFLWEETFNQIKGLTSSVAGKHYIFFFFPFPGAKYLGCLAFPAGCTCTNPMHDSLWLPLSSSLGTGTWGGQAGSPPQLLHSPILPPKLLVAEIQAHRRGAAGMSSPTGDTDYPPSGRKATTRPLCPLQRTSPCYHCSSQQPPQSRRASHSSQAWSRRAMIDYCY